MISTTNPIHYLRSVLSSVVKLDTLGAWGLEADRISFSFYLSAPENAFFIFSAFYFSAENTSAFSFLFFFFGNKTAVKTKPESQYVG